MGKNNKNNKKYHVQYDRKHGPDRLSIDDNIQGDQSHCQQLTSSLR